MRNKSAVSKFCVILVFCLAFHRARGQNFGEDDFEFVKLVQTSFCGIESLCNPTEPSDGTHKNVLNTHKTTNTATEMTPPQPTTTTTTTTRRLNELPVQAPGNIDPYCCKPCSCNTSTCYEIGDCCPDVLDWLPTVQESQQRRMATCQGMSIKAVNPGHTFWVYGRCRPNFFVDNNQTAAQIKSKCENRERHFDLNARMPVVDTLSRKLYANKFCAICEFANEADLVPLTPRVACYLGQQFTTEMTMATIVKDVLKTPQCDLEFLWPKGQLNFPPPYCDIVTTECNSTGLWKRYDPLIEAGCHSYRAVYNFKYNNVFCYLCNEVTTLNRCDTFTSSLIGAVSFAAILDFTRRKPKAKESLTKCSSSQIYDRYKDVCRNLTCTFPRIQQGGKCVNVGDSISEVAYKLQLKFKPVGVYTFQDINIMVPMVNNYTMTLLTTWRSLDAVFSYELFYKIAKSATSEAPAATENNAFLTGIETLTSYPVSRQSDKDVDKENVGLFGDLASSNIDGLPKGPRYSENRVVSYILLRVEWYFTPGISGYQPNDFIDNVLDLDESNITLSDPAMRSSIDFYLDIVDYNANDFEDQLVDPEEKITLIQIPTTVQLPKMDELNQHRSQIRTVFGRYMAKVRTLKQTLLCPLITFDAREFKHSITTRANGLYLDELNVTFEKGVYKEDLWNPTRPTFSICKDAYVSVTDRYFKNQTDEGVSQGGVTPQGVLSVVCACISIFCAFITLVTYMLFHELRTQPGINNMILCVYLICAQVLFTFVTPLNGNVSETACSLFGALTHFFWLSVLFAMNVCSYHMFSIFYRGSTNRTNQPLLSKSVFYSAYCVGASLVFVVINIVVVYVDTGKEKTGYGDGVCYISRPEMVGYVFALPLGVILLVNLAFFVAVVVKISRSPTVSSSNKKDRNYFKIYVKLSSVTGLTWIFGFLFQFTQQVLFEYIFILLNGGLGGLIFISFVFNRRVYLLFRERFPGHGNKPGYSTHKSTRRLGNNSKTKETTLSNVSKKTPAET